MKFSVAHRGSTRGVLPTGGCGRPKSKLVWGTLSYLVDVAKGHDDAIYIPFRGSSCQLSNNKSKPNLCAVVLITNLGVLGSLLVVGTPAAEQRELEGLRRLLPDFNTINTELGTAKEVP